MGLAPVIRVFGTYRDAEARIRALEAAGVDPRSISVVTRSPRDADTLEHDTGTNDDTTSNEGGDSAIDSGIDSGIDTGGDTTAIS